MAFNMVVGGCKTTWSPAPGLRGSAERNPGHEGKEEPQYCYLPRKVSGSGLFLGMFASILVRQKFKSSLLTVRILLFLLTWIHCCRRHRKRLCFLCIHGSWQRQLEGDSMKPRSLTKTAPCRFTHCMFYCCFRALSFAGMSGGGLGNHHRNDFPCTVPTVFLCLGCLKTRLGDTSFSRFEIVFPVWDCLICKFFQRVSKVLQKLSCRLFFQTAI